MDYLSLASNARFPFLRFSAFSPGVVLWGIDVIPGIPWYCIPGIRALIRCVAVALAQQLGRNSRFAQQPPRGWLRAAQHAILGAQHFWPQTIFFVAASFSPQATKKNWVFFFLIRRRREFQAPFLQFAVGIFFQAYFPTSKYSPWSTKINWRLLLFAVGFYSFFRHFLLFAVAENKLKGAFRFSP